MNMHEQCDLDILFRKKYSFEKCEDWLLPSTGADVFTENLWNIGDLQKLKQKLNVTKSELNDKGVKWQKHTQNIDKSGLVIDFIRKIIKPEILTRAWCKFYEILSSYSVIPVSVENIRSLHICEAPGAFVSALNYYLCSNYPTLAEWKWYANTLNPYYEGNNLKSVIVDDRLLFPTLNNWHFGQSNTGDIMESDYVSDISAFLQSRGPVHLVTADGSFNCLENPGEQESLVSELQLKEVLIALSNLAPSGSFVLKKFTFFECITVCTLYLLNCVFEKVHVFKPATSKAGNSEVYVVCLEYQGLEILQPYLFAINLMHTTKETKAMLPLSCIPQSFLTQLHQCAETFTDFQISSINENIQLFQSMTFEDKDKIAEAREACANMYIKKYSMVPIDSEFYFKLYNIKRKVVTSMYGNRNTDLRSAYFQIMGESVSYDDTEQSQELRWSAFVKDIQNKIKLCFPTNLKRKRDEDMIWQCIPREIPKRMKSKSFKNWINTGKRLSSIENSKFCNPMLLHLWNQISQQSQIEPENHKHKSHCYWHWDVLAQLMNENKRTESSYILLTDGLCDVHTDHILCGLKEALSVECNSVYELGTEFNEDCKSLNFQKVVVVNTMKWHEKNSLHQELLIKDKLVRNLQDIIEVLTYGDFVVIYVQSIFTRYSVGSFYLFLSLFNKFVTLLPSSCAPAECGQVWVFAEFLNPVWTKSVLEHLKHISDENLDEEEEILEMVPITSLCGAEYYDYLVTNNNSHLLQRLRNLVAVECIKARNVTSLSCTNDVTNEPTTENKEDLRIDVE